MRINTKFLGEVEIKESEIVSFNQGLPGFPEYKQFILLSLDADLPLALLQSTEEATIGFVVAFPFAFKQDYSFDLNNIYQDCPTINLDPNIVWDEMMSNQMY